MPERKCDDAYQGAKCRKCGKQLRGKPYHMGGGALLPLEDGGGRAKVNHYGGYVCSYRCDYGAALDLEQSMPGHMGQTRLSPPLSTKIFDRWEADNA